MLVNVTHYAKAAVCHCHFHTLTAIQFYLEASVFAVCTLHTRLYLLTDINCNSGKQLLMNIIEFRTLASSAKVSDKCEKMQIK